MDTNAKRWSAPVIWRAGVRVVIGSIILIILLDLLFGITFYFDRGIHVVFKRMDIGILSPSGEYSLVETSDYSGKYLIYNVVDADSNDFETPYTTPNGLNSRYSRGYG